MANFNPELIEKARSAKAPEELLAMAKDTGIEDFTEESAKAYFDLLHPATGEVADDELANVTGGGCYNKGELVVTVMTMACEDGYVCKHCGATRAESYESPNGIAHNCNVCNSCGNCKYCEYKRGLWLCTNPKKRK